MPGDEVVLVLWGGGPPPDNKPLDVVLNPSSLGRVAELPPIDAINRRFRFRAEGTGTGTLEGRWFGAPWAILPLTIVIGPPAPPKERPTDLEYDGKHLYWPARRKTYKATSGLPGDTGEPDWRESKYYCVKDHGRIPEGTYSLSTVVDPDTYADVNADPAVCKVYPGSEIQKIPRGAMANECEPYWANWGTNRVALKPSDEKTRTACSPVRDGFYLHDSTKGFSHGCVEVEGAFFEDLYDFAKSSKGKRLTLRVKYTYQETQGGTNNP